MTITNYRTALLASGAAIALMAVSVPAWADEISDLRSQIETMQEKIAKMEADTATKKRIAASAAVEAGDKPRTWKLPGTRTSMGIGGYVKLDMIYDLNGIPTLGSNGLRDRLYTDADIATAPDNSVLARQQGQFRFHARQSRVWVQTWTPTDWGELHTHFEGDFFGGTTSISSQVNNGYFANSDFRIRHAYGELGPVLAGQTWSTFNPVWSGAETIDFGGDIGANGLRTAQIRYTHVFPGGFTIMAALEDPGLAGGRAICGVATVSAATICANGIAATATTSMAGQPVFLIPNIVLAAQYDFGNGRVWAGGQLRRIEYDNGAGLHEGAWGWQFAVAGTYRFNPRLAIGGIATVGKGSAAHYGGIYTESVVTGLTPGSQDINTVLSYSFYGWLQVKWTDTIRSNFSAGYALLEVADEVPGGKVNLANYLGTYGANHFTYSAHANLIWSPVPQVDFGVEYIYFMQSRYNGVNGKQSRIQVGMLYRF
ncbi:MAG: DcaP family trimeric outer membrane transporter [Alphaproteobacteria bacterium]